MKIFISQPMSNKTDEEIRAEREKAIKDCETFCGCFGAELNVIDSIIEDAPDDATPLWYICKSLELLSEADAAYFVRGWSKNRVCRIEHIACSECGITIINDSL